MTMYQQCPHKYYLNYVEGIKPTQINSPLFFGSAIDEALSLMLLDKKVEKTEQEVEDALFKTPEGEFIKHMTEKDGISLPFNERCSYFQSDFDEDIMQPEDWSALNAFDNEIPDHKEFFKQCKAIFKSKQTLDTQDQRVFNYMCWLSLKRKGLMLIQAYKEQVMPSIDKVYSIQKDILLPNETGDAIRGKIDFIASFIGDDNIYIVDNKTSSKPYSEDSVRTSDQLAIYCEAENTNKAAYIVVEKKLRIKDPKVRTSIIKDTIPEENMQKTFDKASEILHNIADGVFPKHEDTKNCSHYGKRCEFFGLCFGNSMDGLIKKEK